MGEVVPSKTTLPQFRAPKEKEAQLNLYIKVTRLPF